MALQVFVSLTVEATMTGDKLAISPGATEGGAAENELPRINTVLSLSLPLVHRHTASKEEDFTRGATIKITTIITMYGAL